MIKRWIAAIAAVICSFLGIYDYGEEQIAQGYALMEEEDYAAAQEQFNAALDQAASDSEKKPDEETETYIITEAYRGLGMAAYETQEYQMCIEYLQKALDEGAQETPAIYNLMGISSMKLEDYETALTYFENGILLQEVTTENDAESSSSEENVSEETAPEDVFEETFREMRFNKIVCYEQLLDWENAKLEAEKYVALYPDDENIQKEYTFLKTR